MVGQLAVVLVAFCIREHQAFVDYLIVDLFARRGGGEFHETIAEDGIRTAGLDSTLLSSEVEFLEIVGGIFVQFQRGTDPFAVVCRKGAFVGAEKSVLDYLLIDDVLIGCFQYGSWLCGVAATGKKCTAYDCCPIDSFHIQLD